MTPILILGLGCIRQPPWAPDLAYAIPMTLAADLGHLAIGNFDWGPLGTLRLGSLPGIDLGTRFGLRVPDRILRPIPGGMLIFIGIVLLVK